MQAKLICYSLKNLRSAERVAFRRHVYGFNDHSNNNRYSYKRQGIMSSIPHRKILDCVVIVKDSNADAVIKAMRKYRATVFVFPILAPFKL